MKIISKFVILFFIAGIFATSCSKDDSNASDLNATDTNFMQMAAYANHDEISFAQLALMQSTNDTVKAFAQKMITDHTMGLNGLDSLASKYNLTLPTDIDSMHAALKTNLMTLSGVTFDTAYINGQVKDHQTVISLFQKEQSNGSNQNIKAFATRNLPMLQMHLQAADSIKATLP